jgi:hypothetical protein
MINPEPSKLLDKQGIKNMSLDIIEVVEKAIAQTSTEEGILIMAQVARMTGLMLEWVYNKSEQKLINE